MTGAKAWSRIGLAALGEFRPGALGLYRAGDVLSLAIIL